MSCYIRVNHSKLEAAASAIEKYTSKMKTNMAKAKNEVNGLATTYQGADYTQFKDQWDQIVANDSNYTYMKKSFETYASFLRDAANKYKKAQANAINRANSLPRW